MNYEVTSNLIDTTIDYLNALINISVDVRTRDIIIIHIATFELDPETRKQWELHISNSCAVNELPPLNQFNIESRRKYKVHLKRVTGDSTLSFEE